MQGVPRVCAPCVRVRLCGLLVVLCGYVKGVLGVGVLPIPGTPVQVLVRRRATLPHPAGCSTIAVPGLSFQVRNARLVSLMPPPPWAGCGSRGSGTGQGRERALASLGSSIARDPR